MNKALVRGLAVGAVAALTAGIGVSYAAWIVSGSNVIPNEGNAKTYKSVPLTVVSDALPQAAYPTLSSPQVVTVTNDNAFAVQLSSLSTSITSGDPNCNSSLTNTYAPRPYTATINTDQLVRLAKGQTATINVPLVFTNDFPQACEDKPLNIRFSAQGSSVA